MGAKDILGLPKSFPGTQEKKPRQQKEPQRKPDGISREVYALTGGIAPLMPSIEVSHLKQRPVADKEKVRVVNGVPPTGDYQFAKYNKLVDVVKYTDEEYEKYLTDYMWTKEETDQLFDMCERFDLRFIIIVDRFPTSRIVEELKSRYYSVSRALLIARAPSVADVVGHPLVKEPYDMAYEMERKRALSTVLSQTKQQEIKDTEILSEAKRIMESRIASKLRVYLRTHALDQMVQAASSNAGPRTIKRVEQTLSDLGAHIKPKVPTKAVCAEHLELRKEILTLFNLQKQI